jgi:hypothetical protein
MLPPKRHPGSNIVASIRAGTYKLDQTFEARAPLTLGAFMKALGSWSVFPVYLGLLLAYLIAAPLGWLQVIAIAANK